MKCGNNLIKTLFSSSIFLQLPVSLHVRTVENARNPISVSAPKGSMDAFVNLVSNSFTTATNLQSPQMSGSSAETMT